MSEAPKRLWISFADLGDFQPLHIRQWQSTPFAEGTEYISTPIAAGSGEARELLNAFSIYAIEEGEGIRLSTGGICIASYDDGTPEGIALLKLEAYCRALRAALSTAGAAEPVMAWQSIETAPTNRAILIHLPNLDYYGNDGVYAGMLVDMGTGRRWMTFGWAMGRDLGHENAPVAWRPIPAPLASPPSDTEEKAP